MTLLDTFVVICLAALIHASFQLSVSVLTLMSGHALGKKTAHRRVLRLNFGFITGVSIMTALLVSFTSLVFDTVLPTATPLVVWAAICGIAVGVGVAVWLLYFQRKDGTVLWIPRAFADFLTKRAEATKNPAESFSLGLSSVVGELIFCIAPVAVTSLLLLGLEAKYQLLGIILYTAISVMPLLVVTMLMGGGHSLGKIQRWRERNKTFLQFAAGSALIVMGIYLYVDVVLSTLVNAGAVR